MMRRLFTVISIGAMLGGCGGAIDTLPDDPSEQDVAGAGGKADGVSTSGPNTKNSMAVAPGPLDSQLVQLLAAIEGKGYDVFPVDSLDILNSGAPPHESGGANSHQILPDDSLAEELASGKYDAVTNATFKSGQVPLGVVVRDGVVDPNSWFTPGGELEQKTRNRGGVAVLDDGTIVVARTNGISKAEIDAAFGGENRTVDQFVGGGALLIENGAAVSGSDLYTKQWFRQGLSPGNTNGLSAEQMRKDYHTFVGVLQRQVFVVQTTKAKTAKLVQTELRAKGFTSLVKFDGASGFFSPTGIKHSNPTGFGIHTRSH